MRKISSEKLEQELKRLEQMREYERKYEEYSVICGIDEAGRGPLAGPVVAAAAVLPKDAVILWLNEINILQATYEAMRQAVSQLPAEPDIFLNDAVMIPGIDDKKQVRIIKGDAKSVSIAAASVLAKVTRVHMMEEYDKLYPEYGFAKHKGYGTKAHMDAIREFGVCPIHRRSFLTKMDLKNETQ